MADVKDLRNKRGKAIADARAILDKAEEEKRSLTTDESTQYDKLIADSQRLKDDIAREERQLELEREAAELAFNKEEQRKEGERGEKAAAGPRGSEEYRSAYEKFMRFGKDVLSGDEIRALSSGTDTQGGFLLMPEQMVGGILQDVDDMVFIRQRATKFSVPSAGSLGVPTLDADPDDADWTVELATGNEDSAMAFGKRNLEPHPVAKRIKISRDLLNRMPGIEAFVKTRLAYKFGITQEKAFLTGTGAQQPLGLFIASANGIPTSRDVSDGNAATAPTFDGLINAKYTLKGQYWNRADWLFHRDCLKILAKIKDGEGQYIWRESVRSGEPDLLLGRPVMMSEYVPNTFTSALYVGILGDFSNYWIADALDMELQRLVELYAETNQIGLIGRMKMDGMPVLSEAFVRVKLG
jgi:HK97 family phage major capsid protein